MFKLNSLSLILGLALFFGLPFGDAARAQETTTGDFYVAPSVFYYGKARSRSSKDDRTYMVYDLKFSYQVHPNVYAGIGYQAEEENVTTSGYSAASLNNSSKSTRTSWGPNVGYITPTWHAIFTYYYDSKWELNTTTSGGSNKYAYSGDGMQLDFGYKIQLWKVLFGPQLSYKTFTYSKLSTDGGAKDSISPKLKETGFEPSLTAFYFF
jgi:hypothetical protein